jgi:UDP-2,3-diacylglucosamine pyrophosphatase LpxH
MTTALLTRPPRSFRPPLPVHPTLFSDLLPISSPRDAVIISDLHLGAENCQAKPIADFLQQLLDGHLRTRQLIINGDVFDSIDFRRLKKTHWKVLSQIRHLSDKIDIVWIAGNHDGSAEIVSQLLGVRVVEQHLLTSGNKPILIIHGHAFDDFIEDHPVLTWIADLAYFLLQKIDRTHYIARLAKRKSKIFVRCTDKIRDGACALAARLHCDTVICGHTHHAEANEPSPEQPIAYYNSGCWTESPCTYLTIDDGEVRLHHYSELPVQNTATVAL